MEETLTSLPINGKKVNRIEFLKEVLIKDFLKAVTKGKFIPMEGNLFSTFSNKFDYEVLNKTLKTYKSASVRMKIDTSEDPKLKYIDPAFFSFKSQMGISVKEAAKYQYELIFEHFLMNDPTPNKEYLNWYINLYREMIKQRKPFNISKKLLDPTLMQDGSFDDLIFGGIESRFFEDFYALKVSLEKFDSLKKTSILNDVDKDINKFKKAEELIKLMRPFMGSNEDSDEVDTLDNHELMCLENQVVFEKKHGHVGIKSDKELSVPRARIMYQDEKYIIVHTINKSANDIYGKNTTWCTAGTRYGNMFDTYDKQGFLFVLIEKGKGSKKEIDADPNVRMQFHFQSKQYMEALDKSIPVEKFLEKNQGIKNYFKKYILEEVISNMKTTKEHIDFLTKLGYGDQLIKMYKEQKVVKIDLSNFSMKYEDFCEIGEITSLETLIIRDCDIKSLPDSFSKLKKLKHLDLSSNQNLQTLPTWLREFTELVDLKLTACDITTRVDVTGMVNLKNLTLDFNSNMEELPKGIGTAKNLTKVTASSCNLKKVDDEILNCGKLELFDVHHNINLETVPLGLSKIPSLFAITIDDTKVSMKDIKFMEENAYEGNMIICYKPRN